MNSCCLWGLVRDCSSQHHQTPSGLGAAGTGGISVREVLDRLKKTRARQVSRDAREHLSMFRRPPCPQFHVHLYRDSENFRLLQCFLKVLKPVLFCFLSVTATINSKENKGSKFDIGSFVGGIALTLGILSILYIGCKVYYSRRGIQYRTM